jgi:hypothetical protein
MKSSGLSRLTPYVLSVLRLVAAFVYVAHGNQRGRTQERMRFQIAEFGFQIDLKRFFHWMTTIWLIRQPGRRFTQ